MLELYLAFFELSLDLAVSHQENIHLAQIKVFTNLFGQILGTILFLARTIRDLKIKT